MFQETKECLQQFIRDIGPSMGEENDVGLVISGKVRRDLFGEPRDKSCKYFSFSEPDACFVSGAETRILGPRCLLPSRHLLQVIGTKYPAWNKWKRLYISRVTPIQKAEVVELVKKSVGAITLAIGDGAK